MNRTRVWLVVSPVIAAGVLVAHALAYRLTSTPTDPFHAYLGHAPQVLLLLALAGVVLAAFGETRRAPNAHVFPFVALAAFAAQEHLERIVHGGVPVLVTSPAFLVGLALQVPAALLAWVIARWVLRVPPEHAACPTLQSRLEFRLVLPRPHHVATVALPSASSRGPPRLLSL